MKSNGLCLGLLAGVQAPQAASVPASQPAVPGELFYPMPGLLAVGVCTLAVWIVRRISQPHKLTLRGTPGRPSSLTPAHILLVLAAWLGLQQVAVHIVSPDNRELAVLVLAIGQGLWLALGIVVAAITFRHGLRRGLGLSMRHWLYDTGRGLVGYFAVLPICMGLYWLTNSLAPRTPEDMHVLLRYLPKFALPWKALIVLSAVVLAPMAEEVFFRGLVQTVIRRYTQRPWVAVVAAAVLFALVHQPYWKDMPSLLALAIALGYNYERCGRLYPAILIHALFNAVNLAIVFGRG